MKLIIETQILAGALRQAAAMISSRNLLPILGNVKIEATETQVIISACDLENFISLKIEAEVSEPGATTVAHSHLSKLADRAQATRVAIAMDDKTLRFESGETRAVLETLPADEFPPFPELGTGKECEADDIILPFTKCSHAMSKEASRYNLMGINLASDEIGTEFTSTDGKQMALFRTENLGMNGIVPDDLVSVVLKINLGGKCRAGCEKGIFFIQSDTVTIAGKLVESKYVNYRQVIPIGASKHVFSANRADLISAVRTCATFTTRDLVALEIAGKGKKQIEVRNDVHNSTGGKASVTLLGTELESQPQITVRFNGRYLLSALEACENQIVRLQYFDDPAVIVIEEGPLKAVVALLKQE